MIDFGIDFDGGHSREGRLVMELMTPARVLAVARTLREGQSFTAELRYQFTSERIARLQVELAGVFCVTEHGGGCPGCSCHEGQPINHVLVVRREVLNLTVATSISGTDYVC